MGKPLMIYKSSNINFKVFIDKVVLNDTYVFKIERSYYNNIAHMLRYIKYYLRHPHEYSLKTFKISKNETITFYIDPDTYHQYYFTKHGKMCIMGESLQDTCNNLHIAFLFLKRLSFLCMYHYHLLNISLSS